MSRDKLGIQVISVESRYLSQGEPLKKYKLRGFFSEFYCFNYNWNYKLLSCSFSQLSRISCLSLSLVCVIIKRFPLHESESLLPKCRTSAIQRDKFYNSALISLLHFAKNSI